MKTPKTFFILLISIFLNFCAVNCTVSYTTPTIISLKPKPDSEQTRSLQAVTPIGKISAMPVDFNKTLLNQNQTIFYLGAKKSLEDSELKKYSISRVFLDSQYPSIVGIMSETIANDQNPLYGVGIANLAQFKTSALAVNVLPDNTGTSQILYLIEDPDKLGNIIDKSNPINDSGPSATKEIKSIACSSSYIFAAVSATDKIWADNSDAGVNRGIAIVYPDVEQKPTYLRVLDATNINKTEEGNKAAPLSLLATDNVFAFRKTNTGISKAIFNPEPSTNVEVDMVWSDDLQRLFVATTDLSRDDNSKEGGILSIAVGRLNTDSSTNTTSLVFNSIIDTPTTLPVDQTNHIIGFYYDANKTDASKVSTRKVRLMHTSTDKFYLITNSILIEKTGTVNNAPTVFGSNGVFALPLRSSSNDPKLIGTLTEIPDVNNQKFIVGVNKISTTIEDSDAITDIFVHGDSVYKCLGSPTDPQSLGIFQSTAIFDASGVIVGWTEWQRVMGSVQKVWGGDVDHRSNNFYFLSSQTPVITDITSNTVRITQWNTTELANAINAENPNTDHNLSSILSQIFPQSEGGIFQIFDFDDQTDGFAKGEFSMMVVVGYNKIALVQTSQMVDDILQPITKFELGKNVIVFNDDSLKNIAPLCCAEVSRMTTQNSGWLFVGGIGGSVVLNKSGNGWNAQTGLSSVADLAEYSFNLLKPKNGSFANIRKIICQNNISWLVTKDAVYSFDISSNAFVTGSNVNETTIDPKLPLGTKISDFLVIPGTNSNTFMIFATTSGLYSFGVGESRAYKVGNNADPAVHLNYVSMIKGNPSSVGNMYVLFSNFVDETGKVYRFYVNGGASTQNLVQAIKPVSTSDGLFVDLHQYRGNFVTDGSFGYSELGKGAGYSDMLHIYEIITNPNDQNYDITLDVNINPNLNWYIGAVTKNSASGSILVPGDWGLIVNE